MNGLQFTKLVLRPFVLEMSVMVVIAFFWAIDFSLRPYLLKIILDRLTTAAPSQVTERVMYPIIFYLIITLLVILMYRVYDLIKMRFEPALKKNIVMRLMTHIMNHTHRYFQNNFAGDLANRVKEVARGISELIEIAIDRFLSHGLALIFAIFTIAKVHALLGFIMAVWITIYLIVSIKSSHTIRKLSMIASRSHTRMVGNMVDVIANMMTVRLFAGKRHEEHNLEQWTSDAMAKERDLDWFLFKIWFFQGMLFVIVLAISCFFLIFGAQQGYISVGDFGLILTINIYITDCLWNLAKDLGKFSEYWGLVNQGLQVTTATHEMLDVPDAPAIHVTRGEIRFEHVTFSYKSGQPFFNNLSVTIKAGEKIGLVGSSGSGKTTFVHLILRLFDVQKGHIYIDDQDIALVTQDSLRQSISMIPQDPTLFHRHLIDNIRYGTFQADDQQVFEAAQKSHATEFIANLAHGYTTLVGERGAKLSGGQRQRISIARAVLKNTPILILDEATSALDSITEHLIQESFLALMNGRTTMVIAHRLSTLLYMDRILVFDHGAIVEDGTHEELLQQKGMYQKLWDAQVGGFLLDEEDQHEDEELDQE